MNALVMPTYLSFDQGDHGILYRLSSSTCEIDLFSKSGMDNSTINVDIKGLNIIFLLI